MSIVNGLSAKAVIDGDFLCRQFLAIIQNISAQTLRHAHTGIALLSLCNNCRAGSVSNRPITSPCHGHPIEYTHITLDALVTGMTSFCYLLTLVTDRSISLVRFCCYMYLLLLVIYAVTWSPDTIRQKDSKLDTGHCSVSAEQ